MSDNPKAVVFLLGWASSNESNLRVYENIYSRYGIESIISPLNVWRVFDPRLNSWYRNRANTLLLELIERRKQHLPIFFHCFSNGGAFLYYHILQCWNNPKLVISGVVFDSCPANLSLASSRGFVSSVFTKNPFFNLILGTSLYAGALTMFYFRSFQSLISDVGKSGLDICNTSLLLANSPMTCPELYLYSTSDDVTSYTHVEEFIDRRRKAGVSVAKKRWNDTDHVQHIIKHYTEYTDMIRAFVNNNLPEY